MCRACKFVFGHPRDGHKLARLSVAERDGAGFIQQQHVYIASRLDGAPAHRENVRLIEPAHACNANGGEQSTDGRRREANEQSNHIGDGHRSPCTRLFARKRGEGEKRPRNDEEDDGERHEQNLQRDLIRRFLTGSALDHGDHLVEETFSALRSDADHEPIGKYAGAAGHRAPVTAGFTDDGRGFAGDGAFVHRSRAVDDFAVHRDLLASHHIDDVAPFQIGGDYVCIVGGIGGGFQLASADILSGFTQGICLRPAAPFCDGFCKVCKQHGKPEDQRDGKHIAARAVRNAEERENIERGNQRGAKIDHEHDGVFHLHARRELDEGLRQCVLHHP